MAVAPQRRSKMRAFTLGGGTDPTRLADDFVGFRDCVNQWDGENCDPHEFSKCFDIAHFLQLRSSASSVPFTDGAIHRPAQQIDTT